MPSPLRDGSDVAATTTDAEFRQALNLSIADAIRCTDEPPGDGLAAIEKLCKRLASAEPFSVAEEGEWLNALLDAGWELTAPFDPERWRSE